MDALLPVLLREGPRPGARALIALASGQVDAAQVALLGLSAALLASLVVVERRARALSWLLAAESWPALAVIAACVLWLGHSYLGHGYLLSGDTIAHVSMLRTRADAVLAGQDPSWSNFKYLGLPLQQFYSPTTFWPWLWGTRVFGDAMATLRVLLFGLHALSGLAGFALARELGQRRLAAGFVAIGYAGSFAHLHLLLYRGAIPQALSAVLFPLALLFLHRLVMAAVPVDAERRRRTVLAWAGLVAACAGLLVNYTPFAIVGAVHMAVFALALVRRDGAGRRLGQLAAGAAMAGALAAFVLWPAAMADSEVAPLSLTHLLGLSWPSAAYLDQLLVWRAWRTDFPGGAAYLGLSLVLLAIIGAVSAVLGRPDPVRRRGILVTAGLLLLSLSLRGLHVRDIMFTVLFISLLAGEGADRLLSANRLGRHAPALLLGVVLLDLGSTAVQPIGRRDKGWLDAAGAYLATRDPPTRTVEVTVEGDRVVASSGPGVQNWYPAEFVAGGHVEMATPAWLGGEMASVAAARDLTLGGQLAPATRDLLCLLRVGRIVGFGRSAAGLPARVPATTDEGPLGRTLSPHCAYAVVFAPSLAVSSLPRLDPRFDYARDYAVQLLPRFEAFVEGLVGEMALDRASGTARHLLVERGPVPTPGSPRSTPEAAGISIVSYAVQAERIAIVLDAPSDGFIRLSHAWHPRVVATRNGTEVSTRADITGCVVMPITGGRNDVMIIHAPDPARRIGEAASMVGVAGFLVLIGFSLLTRAKSDDDR